MRRVLVLVALVLAVLAGLGWMVSRWGEPPVHAVAPSAPPAGEQVARGAYLARVGNCMLCHTERGGAPFAGGRPVDTPFGTVYSTNITPDAETGIGAWSAAHFRRALHDGRSRDGRLLYPVFPYTHTSKVSDADVDALFDYLRSLAPVNRPNRAHRLRWPYGTQAAVAVWRALYFDPAPFVPDASRSVQWNRGAYLVQGLGHCSACHSARNALGGISDVMDLSGGLIPMQNWYAPSLASPAEAGVADWPLAEIEQLLATGITERGAVLGPMAEVVLNSTQYLEPGDIRAMAVYLKSLPPAPADSNPLEVPRASGAMLDRGAKLYEKHCASCHGDKGEGVRNAYPPLAGNRAVTMAVTTNLVQVVLHGGYPPATRGNPRPFGMPPFAYTLSDQDVADVVTYMRQSWGNRSSAVSPVEVARYRTVPVD